MQIIASQKKTSILYKGVKQNPESQQCETQHSIKNH